MHFIPQTATVTRFGAPIPEISHLLEFGFKPVKDKEISVVFSNTLTEFRFFKKKCRLRYAFSNMLTPSIFYLFFIKIIRISEHKIKRCANIESP